MVQPGGGSDQSSNWKMALEAGIFLNIKTRHKSGTRDSGFMSYSSD